MIDQVSGQAIDLPFSKRHISAYLLKFRIARIDNYTLPHDHLSFLLP